MVAGDTPQTRAASRTPKPFSFIKELSNRVNGICFFFFLDVGLVTFNFMLTDLFWVAECIPMFRTRSEDRTTELCPT